ncbi:hypothetical protein B0T14DRAFT_255609 [Immersiella caudata]|uniref:Uncharacterized protein n=1 Tax=Immersiella caudata TaxID=314043 RepID=A0AA39WKD7_9PEZI|nr:hypothetical protein B0T14DRAFT_255609 [Immersiella caudata]
MATDAHQWYAKHIADRATASAPINGQDFPWFTISDSPATGRVLIADAAIAPVFLAAITLAIGILVPLLLRRIPRAVAVAWCFARNLSPPTEEETDRGNEKTPLDEATARPGPGSCHLPVLMANCGLFLGDAVASVFGVWGHLRSRQLFYASMYLLFAVFCLVAAVAGPLVALLVSRDVAYGFAGTVSGPCIGQFNFTVGATNYVGQALDHHLRSYELLPFAPTFNFSWTNETEYSAGKPVVEPTSGVVYEQLDGCLLKDEVLCDTRFPRTHKVSVNLSPGQLGLWYEDSWKLRLEGYCLRLNSSSIGALSNIQTNPNIPNWLYSPEYARGGEKLSDANDCPNVYKDEWTIGQGEVQRFDNRKNLITDSLFVSNDKERGYPCYDLRKSLRSLDTDVMTFITLLPSADRISQIPGDELFLAPVSRSRFKFRPNETAHLLCWDETYVQLDDGRSFKTSATWANRSALIAEHGLPPGLNPLLDFANTNFLTRPARFLRGSMALLQSVSEVTAWEFSPTNAPPVPFAAEVHRWAHVGAMDIASKATRVATGYYSRGVPAAVEESRKQGVQSELQDLCNAVRVTREGAVSMPVRTLVAVAVLLAISLAWWAVERLGVLLASWGLTGPIGMLRAFLVLPASTPVSLAVSTEAALLRARGWGRGPEERVVGSASGQPLIRSLPRGAKSGPSLDRVGEHRWALGWGFSGLGERKRQRTSID